MLYDRFEPSVGGTRSNLGLEQSGLHSAPAGINAIEGHHIAEGNIGMLLQKHGANIGDFCNRIILIVGGLRPVGVPQSRNCGCLRLWQTIRPLDNRCRKPINLAIKVYDSFDFCAIVFASSTKS